MEQRYKVIMLPTENKIPYVGEIIQNPYNSKIGLYRDCPDAGWNPMGIYIIDTKSYIQKGDWIIYGNTLQTNYSILQITDSEECDSYIKIQELMRKQVKKSPKKLRGLFTEKIIASNCELCGVYKIPQSLIQSIIDNQQIPEWVELETEYKPWGKELVEECYEPAELHTQLKLSEFGEVIVKESVTTMLKNHLDSITTEQFIKECEEVVKDVADDYINTKYDTVNGSTITKPYNIAVFDAFIAGYQYQAQEMITFAEWLNDSYIRVGKSKWKEKINGPILTTKQLFEQYSFNSIKN